MNGSSHVSILAQKPHVIPVPTPVRLYYPYFGISDTSESGFNTGDGYDRNSFDVSMNEEMFDSLEKIIPEMVRLQEEVLEPGPTQNLHNGSIPLFMSYLADPTIHVYSLCPFPQFSQDDITNLITEILDQRIAPDRAAWFIHNLAKRFMIMDMSKYFIETEIVDPDFFCKFAYYCYTKGLFYHNEFLRWAIKTIPPKPLNVFSKEIIKTHSLLILALTSQFSKDYINGLCDSLLLQQSQLIQFLVIYTYPINNQQKTIYQALKNLEFAMNVQQIRRRAKLIYEIISGSRISPITQIQNILVSLYPHYDVDNIVSTFKNSIILYTKPESYTSIIIELIKTIFWFPENNIGLSSVISAIIESLECEFPFRQFVEILYEHSCQVALFTHFFIEQQKSNSDHFSFKKLVDSITNHRLFIETPDVARDILMQIPCCNMVSHLSRYYYHILTKAEITPPENLLIKIYTNKHAPEESIQSNIDQLKQAPMFFIYTIGNWLIEKFTDFASAAEILFELKLDPLFPNLFQRALEKDQNIALKWNSIPHVQQLIPLLIKRGSFEQFTHVVMERANKDPSMLEVAIHISKHYRDVAINKESHGSFAGLTAIQKQARVDGDSIRDLFRRYSFLCSLHVFDAFHGISNARDFETVFRSFIADLLRFPTLRPDTFTRLFMDFAQSGCVTRPVNFFVKSLLSEILSFSSDELNERLESILGIFFEHVFERSIFTPSAFLDIVLTDKKKRRGAPPVSEAPEFLVRIFLGIVARKTSLFTASNCLTDNNIKGFMQVSPMLLEELLTHLRGNQFPIITDETLKAIESSCSTPMNLGSAYFSLLPDELRCASFEESFEIFRKWATPENSRFLALWLRQRPLYTNEFPLTMALDKSLVSAHAAKLAQAFYDLLGPMDTDDPRHDVYLSAWNFLCQSDKPKIANSAIQIVIQRKEFQPGVINYMNVPLLVCMQTCLEQLADLFVKQGINEDLPSHRVTAAVNVFVTYISRGGLNAMLVKNSMLCLLDCLLKNGESASRGIEFIADGFNYIMCSTMASPQVIQEDLHSSIRSRYLQLPESIQKLIVLNQPPASYLEVNDPLFYDVKLAAPPDQPPPPPIFPTSFGSAFQQEPQITQPTFQAPFGDGYDPIGDDFSFYDL